MLDGDAFDWFGLKLEHEERRSSWGVKPSFSCSSSQPHVSSTLWAWILNPKRCDYVVFFMAKWLGRWHKHPSLCPPLYWNSAIPFCSPGSWRAGSSDRSYEQIFVDNETNLWILVIWESGRGTVVSTTFFVIGKAPPALLRCSREPLIIHRNIW